MGAVFSRIKNWGTTDTLTASDLNAEFDNILTNLVPLMLDDYSVNVAQMQVQTDPGEVGTESLATTLAGELARLRFEIAEIKGTTYHYTTASTSLSQLSSVLGTSLTANRISSGRMSANSSQPMFLIPDGTAATVKLAGAVTNFVYSVDSTQYTISSNVSVTSLTLAPSSNNTCAVNDASLSGQAYAKQVGENGTSITIGTVGTSISALLGQYAAFKTSTEYFIARVGTATTLDKAQRGLFFNSSDTRLGRVALSNTDTITLMKLTWIYANTAGALTVSYTNPRYSGTAPTSPATGDYWYDLANNTWKTYNSTTWVSAGATLVGICIQDTAGTKAARSFDFFKNFSTTNSCEVVKDSTTQAISRYVGPQASVYGTTVKFDNDYIRWNTSTDLDSGEALSTNTRYYFYLKENGNATISTVAPLDMTTNRLGYYHPGETYRCLGTGRTDGSSNFQEVESFFRADRSTLVTALAATVTNLLPTPYAIQSSQRVFTMDCTAGSFTQTLPPAAQYTGEVFTYVRTDASVANVATVQTYVSTETITGPTSAQVSIKLHTVGEAYRIVSTGTGWVVIDHDIPSPRVTWTPTTLNGFGTATGLRFFSWREGVHLCIDATFTAGTVSGTTAAFSIGFNGVDSPFSIAYSTTDTRAVGSWTGNVAGAGGSILYINNASNLFWGNPFGGGVSCIAACAGNTVSQTGGVHTLWGIKVPISGWAS